jgi:hypothetical protein
MGRGVNKKRIALAVIGTALALMAVGCGTASPKAAQAGYTGTPRAASKQGATSTTGGAGAAKTANLPEVPLPAGVSVPPERACTVLPSTVFEALLGTTVGNVVYNKDICFIQAASGVPGGWVAYIAYFAHGGGGPLAGEKNLGGGVYEAVKGFVYNAFLRGGALITVSLGLNSSCSSNSHGCITGSPNVAIAALKAAVAAS